MSKRQSRTVWVLDECLGPICFTFRSLGSGSTGQILAAPQASLLSFPLDLAWKEWEMWEGLVRCLRIHPGLHILTAETAWAKRRGAIMGKSMWGLNWVSAISLIGFWEVTQCLSVPFCTTRIIVVKNCRHDKCRGLCTVLSTEQVLSKYGLLSLLIKINQCLEE